MKLKKRHKTAITTVPTNSNSTKNNSSNQLLVLRQTTYSIILHHKQMYYIYNNVLHITCADEPCSNSSATRPKCHARFICIMSLTGR